MSKYIAGIPVELIPEIEAWGKLTTEVFGKLRQRVGMPPKDIPEDQTWFWTEEWQAKEREADEDEKVGRYVEFDNVEDAIKYLHEQV